MANPFKKSHLWTQTLEITIGLFDCPTHWPWSTFYIIMLLSAPRTIISWQECFLRAPRPAERVSPYLIPVKAEGTKNSSVKLDSSSPCVDKWTKWTQSPITTHRVKNLQVKFENAQVLRKLFWLTSSEDRKKTQIPIRVQRADLLRRFQTYS